MFERFLALVGARPMGAMMAWMFATSMAAMAAASGARLNSCGVTCSNTHHVTERPLCLQPTSKCLVKQTNVYQVPAHTGVHVAWL
jgi:hypothetical protein